MARINVSVPDSLKERMSALDQVNWSEVAQSAFEREIVKHNFEVTNMEQVVERLRVSKGVYESSEHDRGRKEGQEWACRHATYGDLKAISKLEFDGDDFALQFDAALGNDPRRGESFWINDETGRVLPSDEYVSGFWDAATDVFAEVEGKL
jgi:hypothetical protein